MTNKKTPFISKPGYILVLPAILLICSQLAFAPGGNRWVPSWTTQLGLNLDHEPEVDEDWDELSGTIKDPAPFHKMGFSGVSKGMAFKITPMGNVDWAVTIKGKTVNPSKVKFEIPEIDLTVRFVPEKNEKGEAVLKKEEK